MDKETAKIVESVFHCLPKNAIARRAFVAAIVAAGHKCTYCDKANGDKITAFRMYDDNGRDFR